MCSITTIIPWLDDHQAVPAGFKGLAYLDLQPHRNREQRSDRFKGSVLMAPN